MFGYYLQLAFRNLRRNPGITALMIGAVALGIAVCVMTLTMYRAMSGNPIWWKSDRLLTVTMDNWSPEEAHNPKHPDLPPPQLTYRDAAYLMQSDIPARKVVMFKSGGVLSGGQLPNGAQPAPLQVLTRVTTGDFFPMFDVPFRYGGGWKAEADRGPEPTIVLSAKTNEKMFGGVNSVGRTIRWNDREFRVVGVLDKWQPQPKFYDLNNGAFDTPEDAFIPWRWGETLELESWGNTNCWKPEKINDYKDFMASECVWVQMWVELPNAIQRARMQSLLDAHWDREHKAGRFPRKRDNRLTDVEQWLKDQQVVQSANRVLVGLAFAFLAVCLINTVGLLLAKFLNGASIAGVRRALGASRRALFTQHMVEVGVIASAGALLGLVFAALGLMGIRSLYTTYNAFNDGGSGLQSMAHIDTTSLITAMLLAIVATFAAGLYPAWRIGRIQPAVYLKNQ